MQKYALILFSVIIAGCSAAKKYTDKAADNPAANILFTADIKKLNLTSNDFTILKAMIDIRTSSERQKVIGTLKYKMPGIMMLSLRNQTGVEAARIFIDADTILINDRINKKLYHASASYLRDKYGISAGIIPVILGDFISETIDNVSINCENNTGNIRQVTDNNEIIYEITCSKRKVSRIKSSDPVSGRGIIIEFGKFEKTDELYVATSIKISDSDMETNINIDIEKIEKGVAGDIKFIPGKNYEDVLLK